MNITTLGKTGWLLLNTSRGFEIDYTPMEIESGGLSSSIIPCRSPGFSAPMLMEPGCLFGRVVPCRPSGFCSLAVLTFLFGALSERALALSEPALGAPDLLARATALLLTGGVMSEEESTRSKKPNFSSCINSARMWSISSDW